MKHILLLLLVACSSFIYGQDKSYDYCYSNSKGICVYSVADSTEQVIVGYGFSPCISPDGKKIAYTPYYPFKKEKYGRIAVIDLNTRKEVILNTGSNDCYDSMWSPDGKLIAYHFTNDQKGKRFSAVIDANNTGSPNILTEKMKNRYILCWKMGSNHVVVQDKNIIYVLDISGNMITTYKIADLMNQKVAGARGIDRIIFTPDNKKIVFTTYISKSGSEAVYVYDIDSRSTLRLSPQWEYVGDIAIKNNQVLFTASDIRVKDPVNRIYMIDMDGKNLKLLFEHGRGITAKE